MSEAEPMLPASPITILLLNVAKFPVRLRPVTFEPFPASIEGKAIRNEAARQIALKEKMKKMHYTP